MENDKNYCVYCGEKIELDTAICPICGRQIEALKKREPQQKRMNGAYQFLSPIIIILMVFVFGSFTSKLGLDYSIFYIIILMVIIPMTIFYNNFFGNQDNFILEIGKFFSYVILVILSIFAISFLGSSNVITPIIFDALFVVLLVLSPHIRLLKYDNRLARFTYNRTIFRSSDNVGNKNIPYPKVSPYFLYRVEFYIMIILMAIILAPKELGDTFYVFAAVVILDFIIYLILSKWTKLLQHH